MYGKLFILFALAAVALAKEYPPGVHPAVCPNYPICDARALITHTLDGHPIPEWYYNPGVLPVAPFDPKNPTAPRYPAGFNPTIYYYA
ncbi:cuticle protein 1-like [Plodia interpunctella]|uniref:cuticle protein 1-like n=1 Tax=Plodia interpunctella TaxID=58824 RepID=UPI0023688063|nr:cuticle protein 1-like [Plodia interpunctella]